MLFFSLLSSSLLALFSLASASEKTWRAEAEAIIKSEIKAIDARPQNFAVWVKRGEWLATHNSHRQFVPASLSKIPTALTFLKQNSMDKKFKTWVYHTGKIKQGVLEGDLYLKGGGDPTFVTESMWAMVNELKRNDIKKVQGKLFVDESYFDVDYYSHGRQEKRVDRAYDAPVSALSFNWNSLSIYVRPGRKVGDKARVYTDPELPIIEIQNKAKTTGYSKTNLRVDRHLEVGKIIVKVSGSISISKGEKAFYKSVGDAALWTGSAFIKFLNQVGIEYTGGVEKAVTPPTAKLLVEYDSWSIPRVMTALSKFSNNFVAEMLTKHLGKKVEEPGSIDRGLKKIVQFLMDNGWPEGEFSFVNPSGFTRKNTMRADLLGHLLVQARQDFQWAPEFMASLPISGIDGTLKSRMKQAMRGKVRAKTGYLSGVVALAGYMEARSSGPPITFVFLYNGSHKKDWQVRAMFNRLLWRLYQKCS